MRYRLVVKALVAALIVLSAPATPTGAAAATETADPCCAPTTQETPDVQETPRPRQTCPALGGRGFSVDTGPVPDVTGQTLEAATASLARSGFATEFLPSDAAAHWTVIDQSPPGGTSEICGSRVTVTLQATQVRVPDVVGEPADPAKDRIREVGLEPVVAEGAFAEPAVVASQDPAAGTPVAPGTTVTLRLRAPPTSPPDERVKVPDLSGLSADAARRRLDDRGLTLVVGSGDSGRVSAQDPAAGSLVERGGSVTVTLTPGTRPVGTGSPEASRAGESGEESPAIDTGDSVETGASSGPSSLVLLIVIAVLAVLGWLLRRARRGAGGAGDSPGGSGDEPQPSPPSVVCVPYADPSPQVEFRDVAPSFRLDLVCHHDQGRQEIREIVR
ncbi:PASTA domain-containing protein [Nonomuraea turcica]|uniref:PASTA domain-containing protein n=1 Tax=Nonomuraea sp. G32 TaxID=3067274 RepID=UPI00273B0058|nr:PASTA domain-containing protein [Nonomuraea sp. G32]MDP4507200.1 PASTA domain-containing protein [Nonomuraea sp. G32]